MQNQLYLRYKSLFHLKSDWRMDSKCVTGHREPKLFLRRVPLKLKLFVVQVSINHKLNQDYICKTVLYCTALPKESICTGEMKGIE
jgi:hypothetical protein